MPAVLVALIDTLAGQFAASFALDTKSAAALAGADHADSNVPCLLVARMSQDPVKELGTVAESQTRVVVLDVVCAEQFVEFTKLQNFSENKNGNVDSI